MAPILPNKNASVPLSMKLLVDTKAQRVLYAEARKDVVDFLFSLLTLPIGTVVKILSKDSMVGSIGNLYGSVEELDEIYVRSDGAKDALLAPAGGYDGGKLLQLPEAVKHTVTDPYRCGNNSYHCREYVTYGSGATCPNCDSEMTTVMNHVRPSAGKAAAALSRHEGTGFVKGVVTYTVMDDLKVAPMSTISGITLLNSFGVTDIGMLREKTVQLGYAEALEILRVALQSKTVLSDVFLGKKKQSV